MPRFWKQVAAEVGSGTACLIGSNRIRSVLGRPTKASGRKRPRAANLLVTASGCLRAIDVATNHLVRLQICWLQINHLILMSNRPAHRFFRSIMSSTTTSTIGEG